MTVNNERSQNKMEDDVIICRCEEVTESEIRKVIRDFNLTSVNGVKRVTQAGMGLCQGRSCEQLVRRIIAEETEKRVDEIPMGKKRPPIVPVNTETIAKSGT